MARDATGRVVSLSLGGVQSVVWLLLLLLVSLLQRVNEIATERTCKWIKWKLLLSLQAEGTFCCANCRFGE